MMRAVPGSQAIHRGRTHLEELLIASGADGQDTGVVQAWQLYIQGRPQSLGADVVEEIGQGG